MSKDIDIKTAFALVNAGFGYLDKIGMLGARDCKIASTIVANMMANYAIDTRERVSEQLKFEEEVAELAKKIKDKVLGGCK